MKDDTFRTLVCRKEGGGGAYHSLGRVGNIWLTASERGMFLLHERVVLIGGGGIGFRVLAAGEIYDARDSQSGDI